MGLSIVPWLTLQGHKLGRVPSLLYMWLTAMGPVILLLLYDKPVPMWYAILIIYLTSHTGVVIALQSSGATNTNPELAAREWKEQREMLDHVCTILERHIKLDNEKLEKVKS